MIEFVYEARKRSVVKAYDTANGVVYNGAIQSITRSGSTATVTKANHGFLDGKSLTIAGADQAAYNGAITVGGATQNTFTYTVAGTPDTRQRAISTSSTRTRAFGVRWLRRFTLSVSRRQPRSRLKSLLIWSWGGSRLVRT